MLCMKTIQLKRQKGLLLSTNNIQILFCKERQKEKQEITHACIQAADTDGIFILSTLFSFLL